MGFPDLRGAPHALLALLVAACGCGAPNDPDVPAAESSADGSTAAAAEAWPEGTVLVANGEALTADEVDRYVKLMSMVEPQYVEEDHRRKALANISIPMLAARAILPEERLTAFKLAQDYLSHSRETGEFPEGVTPRYVSGTWRDVGMVEWEAARATAVEDFSGLVETPGGWSYLKLLAQGVPEGQPFEPTTQVTVQIVEVPFLETPDLRDLLQTAVDQLEFQVVDPAWEPLVPPYYLYPKKPPEERYQ